MCSVTFSLTLKRVFLLLRLLLREHKLQLKAAHILFVGRLQGFNLKRGGKKGGFASSACQTNPGRSGQEVPGAQPTWQVTVVICLPAPWSCLQSLLFSSQLSCSSFCFVSSC